MIVYKSKLVLNFQKYGIIMTFPQCNFDQHSQYYTKSKSYMLPLTEFHRHVLSMENSKTMHFGRGVSMCFKLVGQRQGGLG